MKKRVWSFVIILMMILTMIPSTVYSANVADGLYFRYSGPWNNGPVENTTNPLMNNVTGEEVGSTPVVFFYYVKDGVETRVLASQLKSSGESVVKVSACEQNGDATQLEMLNVGTVNITYNDGTTNHSVQITVNQPAVGIYSSSDGDINNFLNGTFTVTDTNDTFYLVAKNGWKLNEVKLLNDLKSIARVTWNTSENFATIKITGTPNPYQMYSIYVDAAPISDPTNYRTQTIGFNIKNDKTSLCYTWPEWGQGGPTKPQNPMWQSIMNMSPGSSSEVYFALVAAGVEKTAVTNIVSSDSNVVKVTTNQGSDLVRIEAIGLGIVNLTYTANNKTYTMSVTVDLPNVGAYETDTPSGNSLITDGYVLTEVGDKFYLIARNGYIFNSVGLRGDLNNWATISLDSSKTVATITFTDIPDYFGEFSLDYEVTNPNNGRGDRGDYWVGIINGQPHIEFVYTDDNGTNVFDGIWVTPGGQTDGWMNYADANGAYAIPLDELKSTDESVVKIYSANDPQNPDKIVMEFVGWGKAAITYTDANGKTYEFPVIADFNNVEIGFFTDDDMKEENYIPRAFETTNSNNVFYFMSNSDYDIDNFTLLQGTDTYAKLEVISKHCVKITVTDKIIDLVKYGEEIDFVMSYEMHNNADGGTWTNVDGFSLTNKMCKHTETDLVGVKAATCTDKGYTGDEVCKQCKDISKKGSDIPATGHTYKDGECKDCGDKPVVADKVDKVDTTKPVDEVTPVIKQEAADTTAKDVSTVVDAILADDVTDEVKEAVSDDTIKEIKAELEAGKQITAEIKAEVVDEKELDAEDVKEIKDKLGEEGKVAQFLDLSVMIKSVAADGAEKELGTLNVLSKKITFTIMVPEELVKDGREFYVIRVHDGKAEKLELTKNADGTYSFETDRFSSYALAYDEAPVVPEAPKTADTTNVMLYVVLLAMGCVALIIAKEKSYAL